jgi:hypothetical protein
VRAAKEALADLDPVSDYSALAVLADRGHLLDGTFKAVEGVAHAGSFHDERLIVIVPTDLASSHKCLP